ncbi:MAG TPA: hypothetical protein VHU23_16490 [Rhizomicrobium sp.]|jgi:hypothetical protein|nr:hypothetical protein [Rhizomicrobium sp.]
MSRLWKNVFKGRGRNFGDARDLLYRWDDRARLWKSRAYYLGGHGAKVANLHDPDERRFVDGLRERGKLDECYDGEYGLALF